MTFSFLYSLRKLPGYFFWKPVFLWVLWFVVWRLIFLLFYYGYMEGSFLHRMAAVPAGIRLDLSLSCYLHFLWLPFFIAASWWPHRIFIMLQRIVLFPVILITTLILAGNTGLYTSWLTPLNNRVLLYFQHPSEIMHFMPLWQIIAFPVIITALTWLAWRFFKKQYTLPVEPASLVNKIITTLLTPALFLLFLRGGWQQMPVNESASCYSLYARNNHTAMNPVFYFAHSASQYFYQTNRYAYYGEAEAKQQAHPFLSSGKAPVPDSILTVKKPNVVIIILESWVGTILQHTHNGSRITPFTDSLLQQGVWFSNAYGPGYRTDQGLVSIISGYPAQPDNSIIAFPSKTESLESISQVMKHDGYATSFFYGGELEFANMRNYLVQSAFSYLADKSDYAPRELNSKWGAHDEFVLRKQAHYLKNEASPFLSCVLTLSTHEPFEVPVTSPFSGNHINEKFMHSAWYTDWSLKKYFKSIENTSWYKNTLFILVADHGHHLPFDADMNAPESRRITLVLAGPVLQPAWRGININRPVSQQDIAATLCWLLGDKKNHFPFSRNLFSPQTKSAWYCNENVVGLINDTTAYRYYFDTRQNMGNLKLEKKAKSILQVMYSDFLSR